MHSKRNESGPIVSLSTPQRLVLDSTAALLERSGYRGVTIEAVARMSGVSKSTIYRHWPDKASLVLAAYAASTSTHSSVPDTGDVRVDLEAHLAKLAFGLSQGGYATIVAELVAEALRNDSFALLFRATLLHERRSAFLSIFVRAQRRGQIRSSADLGTAIDTAYGALDHRLLVSGEPLDGAFVASVAAIVLHGLLAPAVEGAVPPVQR